MSEAAGLLTRGSPLHRLPGPEASGVVAERQLPSQRRDRPGLAPGSLTALRMCGRAYHSAVSSPAVPILRSAFAAWAPVVLWAAVIFAYSSLR